MTNEKVFHVRTRAGRWFYARAHTPGAALTLITARIRKLAAMRHDRELAADYAVSARLFEETA